MAGGSLFLKTRWLGESSGPLRKQACGRSPARRLLVVSMKEAAGVKGVWGVSPKVIAVLPGEAGRVKRGIA